MKSFYTYAHMMHQIRIQLDELLQCFQTSQLGTEGCSEIECMYTIQFIRQVRQVRQQLPTYVHSMCFNSLDITSLSF